MKTISIDIYDNGYPKMYTVYRAKDELLKAIAAKERGENVLVARKCAEPDCSDLLLGEVEVSEPPTCEGGYHNTRPGVWY